jgi:alpha-glucosidase
MQWDGSARAGFTTGDSWLPVSPATATVNVEAQRDDPRSMFSWFRTLIRERRSSPALRRGAYATVDAPPGLYAYLRETATERRLVVLNFRGRPLRFTTPESLPGEATIRLSTDPERSTGLVGRRFVVGGDEGVLVDV